MQLGSHIAGGSVWKGKEDHIVISKRVLRCLFNHAVQQRNQLWMVLAEQRSSTGTCGQSANFHSRVRKQQPEELSACITCSACYCNPYSHSHEYAINDNFMHNSVSEFARWRSACAWLGHRTT
jgi:hypothetical protein